MEGEGAEIAHMEGEAAGGQRRENGVIHGRAGLAAGMRGRVSGEVL
jgi:hypothetical protein